jgi:hypothetical protein
MTVIFRSLSLSLIISYRLLRFLVVFPFTFHRPPHLQHLPIRPSSITSLVCIICSHLSLLPLPPPASSAHISLFQHFFRLYHLPLCSSFTFSFSLSTLLTLFFYSSYALFSPFSRSSSIVSTLSFYPFHPLLSSISRSSSTVLLAFNIYLYALLPSVIIPHHQTPRR